MHKSLTISRLQLGTIGVLCCIVGTRILLRIGSPEPSIQKEDPVLEQIQLQTQELLDHSDPWDVQSIEIPRTDNDIPSLCPVS